MDIKIICPCGAHFAFEVEPENGRMPVDIACPTCGADATELANTQIRNAQPSPAPARAAVRVGTPKSTPTIAQEAAPTPDSSLARCGKHATETAITECAVCGKPMCHECVALFGSVCSAYCRQQAENRGLAVPLPTGTRQQSRQNERRNLLRVLGAIPVVLALLGLVWAYYFFYASRPRPAWTATATATKPFAHALWRDPGQVLALNGDSLMLLDAATGKPAWTAAHKAGETLPAGLRPPPLALTKDAAWVVFTTKAVRFQLTDGQRKTEIPLPAAPEEIAWSPTTLATSSPGEGRQTITWIDLASSQSRTETLAVPVSRPIALGDDDRPGLFASEPDNQLFATTRGAGRLACRLLQANEVPMTAPGQRETASVLDKESLRASDSDRAGAEFLRGTAETRRLDLSRYAVAIRWLGDTSSEWKGETIGRPVLYSLPTVAVLAATTNLQVLGAHGELRWASRLAYPIDDHFSPTDSSLNAGPCREIGGRLYVADLANLTAFDLNTGQVHWRMQAIGIRDLQPAPNGGLYVTATTASPNLIVYHNPKDADASVQTLLVRLDNGGRELWRSTGFGDRVMASGNFLYVTHAQSSRLDAFQASLDGGDAPLHYRVYRLNPKDGSLLWEYYQPRAPLVAEARRNAFFLLYRRELQAVRYSSFD